MWRFRRENLGRKIIFLFENIFLIAGVVCLFFGFTPNGFKPHAREEAWGLALPLFAVAVALLALKGFVKR